MKKFFLVFALVFFFAISLIRPIPANASFVDDIKNGLRDFWYEVQVSIPFVPKSAKLILWKMSRETNNARSATMKMDGTAKIEGSQPVDVSFGIESKGIPMGAGSKTNKDMDANFNLNLKTQGVTVSAKGQFIQKDKDSFFKLAEGPNLGIIDLSKLTGVWYKMPAASVPATGTSPSPALSKDVESKINLIITDETNKLMSRATKLADVKVEGEDTYKIQVVLTREDVSRIINEMTTVMGSASAVSPAELAKSLETMNDVTLTLNVYKKNWYLARVAFDTKLQAENPAAGMMGTAGKMDVNLNLGIVLKDYNVAFSVSAPTNFKEFNPLSLYGGMLGGGGLPTKGATGSGTMPKLPPGVPSLPAGYKLPVGY